MSGRRVSVLLIVLASLFASVAAKSNPTAPAAAVAKRSNSISLAEAKIRVEVNSTDGDAGLQVFLDAEPWRTMTITNPDGQKIVDFNTRGSLKGYGLTELFSESSEPSFDEFPIEEFKELFPEGEYKFAGRTIEGERLVGEATLTHDFPEGPEITSPVDGATVSRDNAIAEWVEVTEPPGIDIVAYQVIVTREDPLRVFSADLPASARSLTIPSEFLESGTEYKLEVLAIEAGGNQTLTEIVFAVS